MSQLGHRREGLIGGRSPRRGLARERGVRLHGRPSCAPPVADRFRPGELRAPPTVTTADAPPVGDPLCVPPFRIVEHAMDAHCSASAPAFFGTLVTATANRPLRSMLLRHRQRRADGGVAHRPGSLTLARLPDPAPSWGAGESQPVDISRRRPYVARRRPSWLGGVVDHHRTTSLKETTMEKPLFAAAVASTAIALAGCRPAQIAP
jgi:hypothetical protein